MVVPSLLLLMWTSFLFQYQKLVSIFSCKGAKDHHHRSRDEVPCRSCKEALALCNGTHFNGVVGTHIDSKVWFIVRRWVANPLPKPSSIKYVTSWFSVSEKKKHIILVLNNYCNILLFFFIVYKMFRKSITNTKDKGQSPSFDPQI